MTAPRTEALLSALRPRGLRERAHLALSGGWSAAQVLERLPAGDRAGVGAADVQAALDRLVQAGTVARTRAKLRVEIAGKGARDVLVDVYRA